MTNPTKPSQSIGAKQKILEAAGSLARETGPGHISLEAVAKRAGISKGGLLYHFPSKAKLLEAMVADHVRMMGERLKDCEAKYASIDNTTARAFIDMFLHEQQRKKPPPSGLMIALAENPNLLEPVRDLNRKVLDQMRENAGDPDLSMIIFLALNGIKLMELLNVDILDKDEFAAVIARLRSLAQSESDSDGSTD